MKNIAMVFVGLIAVGSAGLAHAVDEAQIAHFMENIPEWGEPAKAAAIRRSNAERYAAEVESAQNRSAGGQSYSARIAARNSRMTVNNALDNLGKPSSTYKSNGYEVRTYQSKSGKNIKSVTLQNGDVTGVSNYSSR